MAIPSCLTDGPDFYDADPNEAQKVDEEDDEEEEDNTQNHGAYTISGGTAESAFGLQLNRAAFPFKDLSKETKDLEGLLYNILLMNVKGSKNSLLFCVKNPSYVQAIIVLSKHVNISRNERKTKVLDALDQLKFTGNVQTYQIKTMELVHELFDSGVSMMDYALAKIMKSFEGKSKTIQYQIAHDINTKEIDDNLNLFDLIQGYCSQIACVGDMQVTVNTVDNNSTPHGNQRGTRLNDACNYCGKKGHAESDCWAKQTANGTGDGPPTCGYCNRKGHIAEHCRTKREADRAGGVQPQAPNVNNVQAEPPPPGNNMTSNGIEHLINNIKHNGSNHRCHAVAVTHRNVGNQFHENPKQMRPFPIPGRIRLPDQQIDRKSQYDPNRDNGPGMKANIDGLSLFNLIGTMQQVLPSMVYKGIPKRQTIPEPCLIPEAPDDPHEYELHTQTTLVNTASNGTECVTKRDAYQSPRLIQEAPAQCNIPDIAPQQTPTEDAQSKNTTNTEENPSKADDECNGGRLASAVTKQPPKSDKSDAGKPGQSRTQIDPNDNLRRFKQ